MSERGFIRFAEENKDAILAAIEICATHLPSKMRLQDYRFDKSKFFLHHLLKQFNYGGEGGSLKPRYITGLDFTYGDATDVSAKIQEVIFQREKIRGEGLTEPRIITMVNSLKENANDGSYDFSNFDYLMAIERGDTAQMEEDGKEYTISVGFGIISSKNLQQFMVDSKNDQVKVKIPNNWYELLKTKIVSVAYDKNLDSELNDKYSRGLANLWDEIVK